MLQVRREEGLNMVLFKPRHAPLILRKLKWQTRRAWKKPRAKVGSLHWAQLKMFDPASRFARLHILKVWQEPLGKISRADAKAEGGNLDPDGKFEPYDKKAFLSVFDYINGPGMYEELVYAIEFEVVVQCPKCGTFNTPVDVFDDRAFEKHDTPLVVTTCPGGRLYPNEEAANKGDGPFKILTIGYACEKCGHHWGEKDWLTTIEADEYGPWWD